MTVRQLCVRLASLAGLGLVALSTAGCGSDGGGVATATNVQRETVSVAPDVAAARGRIVSARRLGVASAAQARELLGEEGLPAAGVRRGVVAYELVYVTIDPHGRRTEASGLVALPRGADGPLPVVVYHHGTIFAPDDAPSRLASVEGAPVAALFASDGFAYAAPDYVGLGSGRGAHPYLHASSEATASLDLLRALREFAAGEGVRLEPDLYVTGFSQGGQAAMALAELLAAEPEAGTRVRAVAPIAGPLDLSGATWTSLFADQFEAGSETSARYLAKALLAWDRVYGLFDDPGDVFASPYAATVAGLVERGASSAGPPSVQRLLRDDAVDDLREPDGALARALRANDGCRRSVTGRVRIYQGDDDEIVVPENAARCQGRLAEQGVDADVVMLRGVGHSEAGLAALPRVARWFDRLATRHLAS